MTCKSLIFFEHAQKFKPLLSVYAHQALSATYIACHRTVAVQCGKNAADLLTLTYCLSVLLRLRLRDCNISMFISPLKGLA